MKTKLIIDTTSRLTTSVGSSLDKVKENTEIHVEKLLIERKSSGKTIRLDSLRNLSRTSAISINVKRGDKVSEINVPKVVLNGIQDFLQNDFGSENPEQDCFYFARKLMGEKNHPEGGYDADRYEVIDNLSEHILKSGDVLQMHQVDSSGNLIIKGNTALFHFAIYIGDGFFISKCGAGGDIITTTMENLQKMYPYNLTFIMTQKDSSN